MGAGWTDGLGLHDFLLFRLHEWLLNEWAGRRRPAVGRSVELVWAGLTTAAPCLASGVHTAGIWLVYGWLAARCSSRRLCNWVESDCPICGGQQSAAAAAGCSHRRRRRQRGLGRCCQRAWVGVSHPNPPPCGAAIPAPRQAAASLSVLRGAVLHGWARVLASSPSSTASKRWQDQTSHAHQPNTTTTDCAYTVQRETRPRFENLPPSLSLI